MKVDLVYGRHPVWEALQGEQEVDRVWIARGTHGELIGDIRKKCKSMQIPVVNIPPQKLNKTVKGNHQGVAAFFASVSYQSLSNVLPSIYDQGKLPFLLLLDKITDVRNLGAIARTAYAAGVDALVVPRKGAAAVGADAMKTSAGALQHLSVCREASMNAAIGICRENGIKLIAASEKASLLVNEVSLELPCALILGAEDKGIHPAILDQADAVVRLPTERDFDSYNVSVAAGMIMYEVMRQN